MPEPTGDLRERLREALTREHYRRAREQIEASPEEHAAAFADAVLPVVEDETAALRSALKDAERERETHRKRAEEAERQRDEALAALTTHAAEAHRRKWAHSEDNQAAFDALHRIGNEILASLDRAFAALKATQRGES